MDARTHGVRCTPADPPPTLSESESEPESEVG